MILYKYKETGNKTSTERKKENEKYESKYNQTA